MKKRVWLMMGLFAMAGLVACKMESTTTTTTTTTTTATVSETTVSTANLRTMMIDPGLNDELQDEVSAFSATLDTAESFRFDNVSLQEMIIDQAVQQSESRTEMLFDREANLLLVQTSVGETLANQLVFRQSGDGFLMYSAQKYLNHTFWKPEWIDSTAFAQSEYLDFSSILEVDSREGTLTKIGQVYRLETTMGGAEHLQILTIQMVLGILGVSEDDIFGAPINFEFDFSLENALSITCEFPAFDFEYLNMDYTLTMSTTWTIDGMNATSAPDFPGEGYLLPPTDPALITEITDPFVPAEVQYPVPDRGEYYYFWVELDPGYYGFTKQLPNYSLFDVNMNPLNFDMVYWVYPVETGGQYILRSGRVDGIDITYSDLLANPVVKTGIADVEDEVYPAGLHYFRIPLQAGIYVDSGSYAWTLFDTELNEIPWNEMVLAYVLDEGEYVIRFRSDGIHTPPFSMVREEATNLLDLAHPIMIGEGTHQVLLESAHDMVACQLQVEGEDVLITVEGVFQARAFILKFDPATGDPYIDRDQVFSQQFLLKPAENDILLFGYYLDGVQDQYEATELTVTVRVVEDDEAPTEPPLLTENFFGKTMVCGNTAYFARDEYRMVVEEEAYYQFHTPDSTVDYLDIVIVNLDGEYMGSQGSKLSPGTYRVFVSHSSYAEYDLRYSIHNGTANEHFNIEIPESAQFYRTWIFGGYFAEYHFTLTETTTLDFRWFNEMNLHLYQNGIEISPDDPWNRQTSTESYTLLSGEYSFIFTTSYVDHRNIDFWLESANSATP